MRSGQNNPRKSRTIIPIEVREHYSPPPNPQISWQRYWAPHMIPLYNHQRRKSTKPKYIQPWPYAIVTFLFGLLLWRLSQRIRDKFEKLRLRLSSLILLMKCPAESGRGSDWRKTPSFIFSGRQSVKISPGQSTTWKQQHDVNPLQGLSWPWTLENCSLRSVIPVQTNGFGFL